MKGVYIRFKIYSILVISLTFLLHIFYEPATAKTTQPEVLILNAYHQGEDWSDNQLSGILPALKKVYPYLVPSIEHLDTKRFPKSQHLLFIKQYLKNKYQGKEFDIIMTLDNSALDLMLKYRSELFPNVPIVFTGVNGYSPKILEGHSKITGVVEVQDVAGTLDLAMNIDPKIKSVLVVHDYTSSGLAVHKDMEAVADKFKSKVKIEYTPKGSVFDLERQLNELPSDTIVLLLTYVTDAEGRTLTREESTRLITGASPVPVYAMHETRLGYGIVGGMLLEGMEHGKQASEIALKIISGTRADSIKVEDSHSQPVFDYEQLKRFNISIKKLPLSNSRIINQPISSWTKHRAILIPASVLVGLLLVILAIMSFSIVRIRRAEESLRKSEKIHNEIIQTCIDGYWLTDIKGNILETNPAYAEMSSYSIKELLNMKISDFEALENAVEVSQHIQKGIETGFDRFETFHCRKDKSTYDAEVSFRYLNIEGGRFVVFTRDITERKQAEEALQSAEQLFSYYMDSIDAYVYMKDMENNYTFINKKTEALFNVSRDNLKKKKYTDFDFFDEEMAKQLRENDKIIIDTGQNIEVEETGHPAGTENIELSVGYRCYLALKFPLRDKDDNIVGVCGFSHDITNQKITEKEKAILEAQLQQAQKMESIGTLAGGIAHDFNNILSPIMIHSEMGMMDLPSDSPTQHNLKEIYKAGERARDMVRQILAFSRKEEGERTVIKITSVLKEAIKMLRSFIPTTIDIHQKLEAESDTVFADPTQIHQVLLNLCNNAAHAMREKGGTLEVHLAREDLDPETAEQYSNLNPGSYIKLTVSDTGSGIDNETMQKIFDPYFTTKDVGEGTGMGLAIIHGIVRGYDGDITVESELGKGTTFNVYLPRVYEEASLVERSFAEFPRGTERILFVDDEKVFVDIIQPMLEKLGYEVTARTSSIEALEAFRNNPEGFDLVITDMAMPNMTGKDLAKELMTIRPDIPIILCTGFSDQIDEYKAKVMGINAFLMKPVVTRQIANAIREVLDKK